MRHVQKQTRLFLHFPNKQAKMSKVEKEKIHESTE